MTRDSILNKVLQCLHDNYGMSGSLERLSGENLNYLFTTSEGVRYVAKIVDDDMPPAVVEMEFQAIKHAISSGFSLQLPKIVPNKYRNIETGITIRKKSPNRLRLMTYINGKVLGKRSDISDDLLKNIGISLAKYNLAMQGFDHPAARRSHRWNLVEAGRHRAKIDLLENPVKQDLLAWGFDAWEQAESKLKSLPWQFIHGDMNPENIMIRGDRVTGLVDFGDCCANPTICDLAICLAYLLMDREDPLETATVVTRAYHEIRPLLEAELSVLYPLICGRLATTIAVATARRSVDPNNPNWFDSEESAWRLLRVLKDNDQLTGLIP